MKKEVTTRTDIEKIINDFYEKLLADEHMKHFFDYLNLEKHLPVIVNFWENMLFQTGSYHGGMMWAHIELNSKFRISTEHFERWLALFFMSIDQNFTGENAEFMKKKALEVGQIMNAKIQHLNQSL